MTTMAQIVTGTNTGLHPTAQKLRQIEAELNQQFVERAAVILALLIGMLSKNHVFLLGSAGTGKSLLCRALTNRIIGLRYFEKALTGGTSPEQMFGGIDLVRYTNEGVYVRRTDGTLVTADAALLDELGRANGLIEDELLPVLAERLWQEVNPATGESVTKLPLRFVFGGANSLPTDENTGAAAFYDRFPIRVNIKDVQEVANFLRMLRDRGQGVANPTTLTREELFEAEDVLVPSVVIPNDVLAAIGDLKQALRAEQIIPSGRRWVQAMSFIQAHAFLNGRSEATTADLGVLRFTLWDQPEHEDKVARLCTTVSNPMGDAINAIADKVEAVVAEYHALLQNTGLAQDKKNAEWSRLAGLCNLTAKDIEAALGEAQSKGYSTTEIEQLQIRNANTKQLVIDAAIASMNG